MVKHVAPSGSKSGPEKIPSTKTDNPDGRRHKATELLSQKVQSTRSTIRSNDGSMVIKRRRESNKSHQISEEKLFELLIAKIRMREENEAMAADMEQQLKTDNVQLKGENQSLRGRVKVCEEHIQAMNNEYNSQESQISGWKEKILKFKQIVNDLGRNYEALRVDADKFKATAISLQDERSNLTSSIDDIKLQIVRSERTIDDQQTKIADYERRVSALDQALLASGERLNETLSRLTEEKNRTIILESYIENYSRSQIRQVNLLREDHAKVLEKLIAGLENVSESSSNAKDAILSEIRYNFEEYRSSVQKFGEKCSAETRNVQGFTNAIHDVASR